MFFMFYISNRSNNISYELLSLLDIYRKNSRFVSSENRLQKKKTFRHIPLKKKINKCGQHQHRNEQKMVDACLSTQTRANDLIFRN